MSHRAARTEEELPLAHDESGVYYVGRIAKAALCPLYCSPYVFSSSLFVFDQALGVVQWSLRSRKAGWIELRLWIPGCQEESGMLDFSTDEEEAGREETCDDHLSVYYP